MDFSYPPLPGKDALRLLTLRAGNFFDPLEADLASIAFSEKPRYLALSYTWADPTPEQLEIPAAFTKQMDGANDGPDCHEPVECLREATLALNGYDVPIWHNLALALRYLRSASHPLTLWVDAVCINQVDIDERNSQVTLMAVIFSRAIAVVAWLGLNGPEITRLSGGSSWNDVNDATGMWRAYNGGNSKELAPWFAEQLTAYLGTNSRDSLESRAAKKEALDRIAAINTLGYTMIMTTSYWQRIWVVQEVCVARRLFFMYGPTLLVDEEAMRPAHDVNTVKMTSGLRNMLNARQARFGPDMCLESLIENFAGQMCTEPRDKIYSLISLANDVNAVESHSNTEGKGVNDGDRAVIQVGGSEDVDFIIDYHRSFYDIWCDAVQYLFQRPHYFVPEHYSSDEQHGLMRMRGQRLINLVRFAGLVQNTLQNEVERELAQLAASATFSEMDPLLQGPEIFGRRLVPARGYLAGEIVHLGPVYADFVSLSHHQTAWRKAWRKHYRNEDDLLRLRQTEERYAAKILDFDETDVARVARIKGQPFLAFKVRDAAPFGDLTSLEDVNTDYVLMSLATKGISDAAPDDKVCRFLGTNHCMGLAPPGAALGDWVIRFWDCNAAVLVRPNGASAQEHMCTLVGRADVADNRVKRGDDWKSKTALSYKDSDTDQRVDMIMDWHTLQRITASIAT
jgi:hypothetical protein